VKILGILLLTIGLLTSQSCQHLKQTSNNQLLYVLPEISHLMDSNILDLNNYTAFLSEHLTPSLSINSLLNNDALSWRDDGPEFTAVFDLDIHFSYLYLVLISLILSGVLLAFERYILPVFWTKKVHMYFRMHQERQYDETQPQEHLLLKKAFLEFGIQNDELLNIVFESDTFAELDPMQIRWLACALANGHTVENAFRVALHKDLMEFNPKEQQLTIHGLPITLPKTPLIYYCWYALRQVDGMPAYINPSPSKPDKSNGLMLAELMTGFQGQQQAINDLLEKGLKRKTLEKNHNAIKTELKNVLGDLAQPYLIIGERDPRTARSQYFLPVARRFIRIVI